MSYFKNIFYIFIISFNSSLYAACNFPTGNFISELGDPSSIKNISVEVSKSGKFNRNFAQIIVSRDYNIPPTLKKKFNASVIVNYNFGQCKFKASVKQHGDLRDHIQMLEGGIPLRSIKVSLKEGNILNAVRFSLLIPETRNGINEVFGSILFRELGFIAPETFLVNSSLNGYKSIMLFQEDTRKELLERSGRREGPVFEGDESLLWSYNGYEPLALSPIAMSRMTNNNWFLKGKSSEFISLSAYSRLQQAYLEYVQNLLAGNNKLILPNSRKDFIFQEYSLIMTAMKAEHGLSANNRKYYFNSFLNQFEPIYYDGNIDLVGEPLLNKIFLREGFSDDFLDNYKNKFINFIDYESALISFKKRALMSEADAEIFFKNSLKQISHNTSAILEELRSIKNFKYPNNDTSINSYIEKQNTLGIKQVIVTSFDLNDDIYIANFKDSENIQVTREEVAKIISRNEFNKTRTVFIPENTAHDMGTNIFEVSIGSGSIIYSKNLIIDINEKDLELSFQQVSPNDWVLIKNIALDDWSISLNGIKASIKDEGVETQRFNFYGMTGCLNFYNVVFSNTTIKSSGGGCEDSLNIVSSTGSIKSINIKDAYADAIDIDFSQLGIKKIFVNGAGNDCFDVSGGEYILADVIVKKCGDKGISVGEKSFLELQLLQVEETNLAISSKDLSITKIKDAIFQSINYCYEAKQKKQEFGGAFLSFNKLTCDQESFNDTNSIIKIY
jgi:hypothetical protein